MDQDPKKLTDLKEMDFNLEDILETMTDWVWMMDTDGCHVYSNEAVESLLGYKREEIIGKPTWKYWPDADRENIDEDGFKKYLKKGEGWNNYPGRFKHRDGSTRFLESSAVPLFDEKDTLLGYVGIDRDITKRKRLADKQKFLHSLLRHDLKNKIQITRGYLHLLEDGLLDDVSEEFLQKALSSLTRQSELIDKITKLGMIDEKPNKEVNLRKHVESAIQQIDGKKEGSDIDIKTFDNEFRVLGGDLLVEIFFNLIENSLEHSGCDTIELSAEQEGEEIIVTYEDNGKGVPQNEKNKIFEKGFKGPNSRGSGLGMYLIERILEDYGGEITLEDCTRCGTRFKISLISA